MYRRKGIFGVYGKPLRREFAWRSIVLICGTDFQFNRHQGIPGRGAPHSHNNTPRKANYTLLARESNDGLLFGADIRPAGSLYA